MRPTKHPLPDEFLELLVQGFEDPLKKKEGKKDGEPDDDSDDDDEDEEDEDDEDDENKGKKGDEGNAGLKSALQKERRDRRKLEKENRRLTKLNKEKEDAEKDDTTKATERATTAETKAERLAVRLKDTALDNVIIKLAADFIDVDDALSLIDRDLIEVEQDEDDPSDIEIDKKSVKKALDALKESKPHLVKKDGKPPPPKSGSKFSGGEKSKEQLDEEALAERYPALNRGTRKSKT